MAARFRYAGASFLRRSERGREIHGRGRSSSRFVLPARGQTGGWQPWVGMGSAKAALESTCRYFAVALARDGITVNAVSPGASDETTLTGQTPKEVQDAIKDWVHAGWTPMRRRVTPSDVANACALLCADEASFLTGQTIVVDGGSSLMNPDFPLALQMPK